MSRRADPDEPEAERLLRLVRRALALHETTPCLQWEERAMRNARSRCAGLEPREIRRLLIEHVEDGGAVKLHQERDEEWLGRRKFDYWFSVCFPIEDIGDIFVKLVLVDDDEDLPEVRIVGAHESNP